MKKLIALLLVLGMSFAFAACSTGNKEIVLTIENNDGQTEELTVTEFRKAYNENPVVGEEKYIGASVSFEGEVTGIIGNQWGSTMYGTNMKTPNLDILEFENGVKFEFVSGSHDDVLHNVKKGDRVKVSSEIHEVFFEFVVHDMSSPYPYTSWEDHSTVSIVK